MATVMVTPLVLYSECLHVTLSGILKLTFNQCWEIAIGTRFRGLHGQSNRLYVVQGIIICIFLFFIEIVFQGCPLPNMNIQVQIFVKQESKM